MDEEERIGWCNDQRAKDRINQLLGENLSDIRKKNAFQQWVHEMNKNMFVDGVGGVVLEDTPAGEYAPIQMTTTSTGTISFNHEVKPMNRIVDIYVVDTDEDLPVSRRLMKSVTDKFTDESDDALKMTLNIDIDAHNKTRAVFVDDDDRPLKPIRISDLSVKIVERARF